MAIEYLFTKIYYEANNYFTFKTQVYTDNLLR